EQDADLVAEEQREHQHQAGEQVPRVVAEALHRPRPRRVLRGGALSFLSSLSSRAAIASVSSCFMQRVSAPPKRSGPSRRPPSARRCGNARTSPRPFSFTTTTFFSSQLPAFFSSRIASDT